jgi:hypothetical protein
VDFTKNDAWYDDWCDGWIKARVTFGDGESMDADPAWIACCGSNFAPEIPPFTSLYETIFDGLHAAGMVERPKVVSFTRHIYPIFYRLGLMTWVSGAAFQRPGWIEVGDFSDPKYIAKLADKRQSELHDQVFSRFRVPTEEGAEQYRLPYMLGSGVDYSGSPDHWFWMSELQFWILERWREGKYLNDWNPKSAGTSPPPLDELPVERQPGALTRAALEPCSGGNFHPGVELTWVLG